MAEGSSLHKSTLHLLLPTNSSLRTLHTRVSVLLALAHMSVSGYLPLLCCHIIKIFCASLLNTQQAWSRPADQAATTPAGESQSGHRDPNTWEEYSWNQSVHPAFPVENQYWVSSFLYCVYLLLSSQGLYALSRVFCKEASLIKLHFQ